MKYTEWLQPGELSHRLDAYHYDPSFVEAFDRAMESPVEFVELRRFHFKGTPINYGVLKPGPFKENGGVSMLRCVDLESPLVERSHVVRVSREVEAPFVRSRLEPDDLLISNSGTLGEIGVFSGGLGNPVNISRDLTRVRLNDSCDPYFVATYLTADTGQLLLMREAVGSVQRHINIEDTPRILTPNPHLHIQQAIGNKVRKAERLRELAEAALTDAQTTLNEALCWKPESRKDRSRVNWTSVEDLRTVRLDAKYYQPVFVEARHLINKIGGTASLIDLAVSICNGVEIRNFVSDGQPYLVVGNIDSGDLQIANAPRISVNSEVPAKARLEAGDLLVVRSASIGQAAEILEEDVASGAVISADFIKLRLVEPRRSGFISAFLNSGIGKLFQEQIAIGAVQLHIGQEELGDLPIPNLAEEVEQRIGNGYSLWRRFKRQAAMMIEAAKGDVEALISNTIELEALQTESAAIETWLSANPSPAAQKN